MPDQAPLASVPAARIQPTTLLWLFACFGLATMNAPADVAATLHHLQVPDPDDAMRLAQVRDLVNGQGWYDLVQHRFGQPSGILSHWSRLVDAPMAELIMLLAPLFGLPMATGIAAAFWPMLLFCVYGVVLYGGMRRTFGTRAAILALVVATQTVGIAVQFAAGRVDHHGLQLTIVLGLAFTIMQGGFRAGLAGGALAAASLAVGLEGLPYIAVAALLLTGDWVLRGRPASVTLTGFGLGLGLAAPLLFAGQTDPGRWGATACDALSPPWLYLACGGCGLTLACAGWDRRSRGKVDRLAVVAILGAALVAGFASFFPICLAGPFTGMSDLVRQHWLLKVNEMTSARTFIARGQWEALAFYPVLLIATLVASRFALRGRPWLVAAAFLWPGLILGLVEFRGIYVASGLVPFVAAAFIDRVLAHAAQRPSRRRWGEAAVAAGLVSTIWIAPAALGEALFPWTRTAADPQGAKACMTDDALQGLASLPPGAVLAPVFMGPAILLHTAHSVIAAPYHRAVPEIAASLEGLGGTEADLRRVLTQRHVAYVVACPARPADDLQPETAFATRLARGTASADWLRPEPLQGVVKVWRVTP